MRLQTSALCALLVFSAVGLAYANHFENGFHFDDFHSITQNVFVRDLGNIPKFFTDATTSSALPTNRTWRPVVTASLAIDYALGGGYTPAFFQASTFLWFLLQLAAMYFLFATILRRNQPDSIGEWTAWFAVAWFGLHPAIAETVNYIIQRAEVISTCGVVLSLAIYARLERFRKYHLYLIPLVIGLLAKPPALIFPLLLAAYIVLFEPRTRLWRALAPSLALCIAFAALHVAMTPATLTPGAVSAKAYLLTQPYVAFRYFASFFLPFHLSADTDLTPLWSFWSVEALGGLAFLALLLGMIALTWRHASLRPVAFGLAWFLLALFPTSVFPLAEVENDHRMFFPFVGLVLAVTTAGAAVLRSRSFHPPIVAAFACLLLGLYGWGTNRRNEVWRTEETLWQDVTIKSPLNGRGWMNYGLTQLSKGENQSALSLFERAAIYTPNYPMLEINLAIANGTLGRDGDAVAHFQRSITLDPKSADGYFYYGRWLKQKGRLSEAVDKLTTAMSLNPVRLDVRHLLMDTYAERQEWSSARSLAEETLQLAPLDEWAFRYQTGRDVATPEALLAVSLRAYQVQDYTGSLRAAEEAIRLDPQYAEAFNNIATAQVALGRWDEAIAAAQQALRLKPDFPLARNTLDWALSHKPK